MKLDMLGSSADSGAQSQGVAVQQQQPDLDQVQQDCLTRLSVGAKRGC